MADFEDAPASAREHRLHAAERQQAQSTDKGHGRLEYRQLTSTTALNAYLDWPGVKQVFRLKRRRTEKGRTRMEIAYGITSLDRTEADADRLLRLARGHWSIENRLFYVRDVTLGEDACRVRRGASPQILATARNLVINLLQRAGWRNKARATRHYAANPLKALRLVRLTKN